jgi:hypothetical protein
MLEPRGLHAHRVALDLDHAGARRLRRGGRGNRPEKNGSSDRRDEGPKPDE